MKPTNQQMSFGTFLKKGPMPFMVSCAAVVLSPLLLVRLSGLEHGGGSREWAAGFGIVALMVLLTAFFLSGRFARANGKAGPELILKFHRRIVMVALLFVAGHIVLVMPFDMPDNFLWVGVPLLLFVLSVVLAKNHTRLGIKYEYWRLSHGVSAMIVVGFLCIRAIQNGRYSAHPVLVVYWVAITVLAIVSLSYVHQYLPGQSAKQPYTLVDLRQEANRQWTITIELRGFEPMAFMAGQYAFVSFGDTRFRDRTHPFSFVSSPAELPQIAFTIKESGDFTNTVKNLEVGSNIFLYGPYGHLTIEHYHSPQPAARGMVQLAAGVGFKPMMSLLRDMQSKNDTRPVKVFYACQTEAELLYQDKLKQMANTLDLERVISLTDPPENRAGGSARFDEAFLKQNIRYEGYEEYVYFICGSAGFIQGVASALDSFRTIPVFNIRFEGFSVYS